MTKAFFGDDEYQFKLTGKEIVELERKTGRGIGALYRIAIAHDFTFAQITETLRLALIGGGMDHKRAHELVEAYALPITPSYVIVVEILSEIFGGDDDAKSEEAPASIPADYADAINAALQEAANG